MNKKQRTSVAAEVSQCGAMRHVCDCHTTTNQPEAQCPRNEASLSVACCLELKELRWKIDALGFDSVLYDQHAIDCVEYLSTGYGPQSGGVA